VGKRGPEKTKTASKKRVVCSIPHGGTNRNRKHLRLNGKEGGEKTHHSTLRRKKKEKSRAVSAPYREKRRRSQCRPVRRVSRLSRKKKRGKPPDSRKKGFSNHGLHEINTHRPSPPWNVPLPQNQSRQDSKEREEERAKKREEKRIVQVNLRGKRKVVSSSIRKMGGTAWLLLKIYRISPRSRAAAKRERGLLPKRALFQTERLAERPRLAIWRHYQKREGGRSHEGKGPKEKQRKLR